MRGNPTIDRVRFVLFLAMSVGLAPSQPAAEELGSGKEIGKEIFERQWHWKGDATKPNDDARTKRSRSAPIRRRVPDGAPLEASEVTTSDGLGPLHNATSCAECHVAGGGADVTHNVTLVTLDPRSEGLHLESTGGKDLLQLFPSFLGPEGNLGSLTLVVHNRSTRQGYEEIRQRLADHVPGGISDEWFVPSKRNNLAIAQQPVVAGRYATFDFYLSQRNSPALFGLGRIDAIREERLHELARRQAMDTNGEITGRVAGKFGWRGQGRSLADFVSDACAVELGLNRPPVVSQPGDPADLAYENTSEDMTIDEFDELVRYVAKLPRPVERPSNGDTSRDVFKGEKLFFSIGCVHCHVADLRPASGIFSDLLLHDMGSELEAPDAAPHNAQPSDVRAKMMSIKPMNARGPRQSNRSNSYGSNGSSSRASLRVPAPYRIPQPAEPQFPHGEVSVAERESLLFQRSWDALQREWKTPPLWGVADTAPYLHDGRAATLDEAIRWHGGEAAATRAKYLDLPADQRELVIAFLQSLRAPDVD